MNKQEVIETLQSKAVNHYSETSGWTKEIELDIAIDIVNQIDEPEKPVVPPYIDTWIQGAKYNGFDLYEAMFDNGLIDKANMWIENNSETFTKAWLFGYEVEQEKLYTVEIPNPNIVYGGHVVLKRKDDDIIIDFTLDDRYRDNNRTKLTEAEIKKDFDWAWQFAEEVKND